MMSENIQPWIIELVAAWMANLNFPISTDEAVGKMAVQLTMPIGVVEKHYRAWCILSRARRARRSTDRLFFCAENDQQLWGESPLPSLMEANG
jgi:hypothetical protein